MADTNGFSSALSHREKTTEVFCAIATAWFIEATQEKAPSIGEICDFLEENKIRHNINRTRLRTKLNNDRRVSAPKGKPVQVQPALSREISAEFSMFLAPTLPIPKYRLLSPDALGERPGILSRLNDQMNVSYEVGHYDCAAVMMRRVMECLLIKAFNKSGARAEIVDGKHYLGLDRIIIQSSQTSAFHLSRGSERTMAAIKKVGDKGAHSTSYSVVESDIELVASDFRALITELASI